MSSDVDDVRRGHVAHGAHGADDRAPHPPRARSSTTDQLVGMISIGDVVKARFDQLEHEKKDLLDYVTAC